MLRSCAYPDMLIEATYCAIVMVDSKMTPILRIHVVDVILELPTYTDTFSMYCKVCFVVNGMTSMLLLFSFSMF